MGLRVAIVSTFPFPEGKATANRLQIFAQEFSNANSVEEVLIFSCSESERSTREFSDGIRIVNLCTPKYDKTKYMTRAFHELKISLSIMSVALKYKADIIFVSVPSSLLLVPFIFNFKKGFKILDIRDAVWTYFGTTKVQRLVARTTAFVFRLAIMRANVVTVTNKKEASEVRQVSGREAVIVSNGISEERLVSMADLPLAVPVESTRLVYIGNIGVAQRLEDLINFTHSIQDLEIVFVGDGAELRYLETLCESNNITNISFIGLVNSSEVRLYLESADILFAQVTEEYGSAIPTKVFEYIAAGRKVLLGLPDGPARDIFSKFYGVKIFEPGSECDFLEAFWALKAEPYLPEHRKFNLSELKENYVREVAVRVLLSKMGVR